MYKIDWKYLDDENSHYWALSQHSTITCNCERVEFNLLRLFKLFFLIIHKSLSMKYFCEPFCFYFNQKNIMKMRILLWKVEEEIQCQKNLSFNIVTQRDRRVLVISWETLRFLRLLNNDEKRQASEVNDCLRICTQYNHVKTIKSLACALVSGAWDIFLRNMRRFRARSLLVRLEFLNFTKFFILKLATTNTHSLTWRNRHRENLLKNSFKKTKKSRDKMKALNNWIMVENEYSLLTHNRRDLIENLFSSSWSFFAITNYERIASLTALMRFFHE